MEYFEKTNYININLFSIIMKVTVQVDTDNPLEIQQAIQYLQSLLKEPIPVIKGEQPLIQQMHEKPTINISMKTKSAEDLLQETEDGSESTDF